MVPRHGRRAGFSCCQGEPSVAASSLAGQGGSRLHHPAPAGHWDEGSVGLGWEQKLAGAELGTEVPLGSQDQGLVPTPWIKVSQSGPRARAIGRSHWAEGSYSRSTGAGGRRPAPGPPPGARRPGP